MRPADDLFELAVVMDQVAREVEELADELRTFHRPDVWSGGRARRFGDELVGRQRQVRAVVDQLHHQAADVRSRASLRELLFQAGLTGQV